MTAYGPLVPMEVSTSGWAVCCVFARACRHVRGLYAYALFSTPHSPTTPHTPAAPVPTCTPRPTSIATTHLITFHATHTPLQLCAHGYTTHSAQARLWRGRWWTSP
jgi:hypothetical protein